MEKLLGDILTQGLTPALALAALKLLLIIFIAIAIRNWMTNTINRRLAYRRLKANNYLKAGAWVKMPTSTGFVIAKVDRITPTKVVLRTKDEDAWIHDPILKFANNQLVLLDTAPTT